ncbi:MAG: hypothetical protein IKH20_10445 [Clostridiales bacterium]|nr:hypothetical protein [Clostridiales bacterium]
MFDELREEVLRKLKSGNKPTGIYDLLVQYKQAGMDKETMNNVLESIRAEMSELGEEELEDVIIDYMDYVLGFCSPMWNLYPELDFKKSVMLSVKDIKRTKNEYDISFIKYTDHVSILIDNKTHEYEAPSRWSLTKGCGMYPIIVVVDCKNRLISRITASLTKIMTSKLFVPLDNSQNGDVIVDTSVFTNFNDHINVLHGYSVFIHEGHLIFCFGDNPKPAKTYRNGRLELLIDNCNQIVGFSICDLTEDEIMMLNSIPVE